MSPLQQHRNSLCVLRVLCGEKKSGSIHHREHGGHGEEKSSALEANEHLDLFEADA